MLVGGAIDRSPDRVTLDFEISRDFSLVTLVSMLAPSPDWFVGMSGLNLIENGDWVAEKVVVLQPWDAGTDSGRYLQLGRRADVAPGADPPDRHGTAPRRRVRAPGGDVHASAGLN